MPKTYWGHQPGIVTVETESGSLYALPLRLDLRCHSPTGFAWGYSGSGTSQLALALVADLRPGEAQVALDAKIHVRECLVARFRQGECWVLSEVDLANCVRGWEFATFDAAYKWMSESGLADSVGSQEYRRVIAAWEAEGRPTGVDLFEWITEEIRGVPHMPLL